MENKYILAGIDGSEITGELIRYAAWFAKSNGLSVTLLHTIEHTHKSAQAHHEGNLTPNIRRELLKELSEEERAQSKQLIAEGKEMIASAKLRMQQAGIENVSTKLRHGTLPESISDLDQEIAFVMLGSKGKDHQDDEKGLGFHLEQSIRASSHPVFIAKTKFKEPERIMFAYNGSPTSKRALNMIAGNTFCKGAMEIHIVAVQGDLTEAESLVKEAQTVLSASKDNIVIKALTGDILEQLTKYQKEQDIDVTAMGAFSHGKVHGFFFGSFTTRMIQQSETNFLLIR